MNLPRTLTRNAVNGVATFNNITVSSACTGYTLNVSTRPEAAAR